LPGCGKRRDGPDLDEPEAQPQRRGNRLGIFVKARGEAERIDEGQTEDGLLQDRRVRLPAARSEREAKLQRPDRQPMGPFGIDPIDNSRKSRR